MNGLEKREDFVYEFLKKTSLVGEGESLNETQCFAEELSCITIFSSCPRMSSSWSKPLQAFASTPIFLPWLKCS